MSEQISADIRAMEALSASRGWQIVKESLEKDILAAAMAFADHALMSEKEIDFRRGAIFAARSLLTVDAAILARLQGEHLMASAQADATNRNATA